MSIKTVLNGLAEANEYVTLGIEIYGEIVPLAKGLVKEIKQIGTGTDTVSYAVLIQTDTAELDDVKKLSTDDLEAINAELAKLGKPPIVLAEVEDPRASSSSADSPSDASAPGPAVDPAPGTSSE